MLILLIFVVVGSFFAIDFVVFVDFYVVLGLVFGLSVVEVAMIFVVN
jgi:hypothetical protein